jgi:hypothetical protein
MALVKFKRLWFAPNGARYKPHVWQTVPDGLTLPKDAEVQEAAAPVPKEEKPAKLKL